MQHFVLDWYNEQDKHTFESIDISAESEMEATWQAYLFILDNSPYRNEFLLSRKDNHKYRADGIPNPSTLWSGCFYLYPFSLEEVEDIQNIIVNMTYSQEELAEAMDFIEKSGEPLLYAMDRCIFKKLWNSNWLDIEVTESHTSNVMALFRIAEACRNIALKDYKSVKKQYFYTAHVLIQPLNNDNKFNAHERLLIRNAFRMWQNERIIDNMACELNEETHSIFTFDIDSEFISLKDIRLWFDRHGIYCRIKGIATTPYYDYIDFELGNNPDMRSTFQHVPNIGHGEILERNVDSLLYPSLCLYYDSDR